MLRHYAEQGIEPDPQAIALDVFTYFMKSTPSYVTFLDTILNGVVSLTFFASILLSAADFCVINFVACYSDALVHYF